MNLFYRAILTAAFLSLPIQVFAQSPGSGRPGPIPGPGPRPGPPRPHPHPGREKVLTSRGVPKNILVKPQAASGAVTSNYYLEKKKSD